MPRLSTTEWMLRKLLYYKTFAELQGIRNFMLRWGGILDWLKLSISFNLVYRFLLNLYLQLNLNFDFTVTDFWNFDFIEIGYPEYKKLVKGYYCKARYCEAYYDPPQVTAKELEEALWQLRHKATQRDYNEYKLKSLAMMLHTEYIKDIFEKKGVSRDYLEAIEETLAIVEGKMVNNAYVGLAIVGLSRVAPSRQLKIRKPRDWKNEDTLESFRAYENYVGYARVGYSRVVKKEPEMKKELIDRLKQEIDDFHKRVDTLWQHTFFLQKQSNIYLRGARHQIHLQQILNTTKRILDQEGVVAQLRFMYCLFAQELAYYRYKPHRRDKHYKTILTEDDIIEKYVRQGLDRRILERIRNALTPFIY